MKAWNVNAPEFQPKGYLLSMSAKDEMDTATKWPSSGRLSDIDFSDDELQLDESDNPAVKGQDPPFVIKPLVQDVKLPSVVTVPHVGLCVDDNADKDSDWSFGLTDDECQSEAEDETAVPVTSMQEYYAPVMTSLQPYGDGPTDLTDSFNSSQEPIVLLSPPKKATAPPAKCTDIVTAAAVEKPVMPPTAATVEISVIEHQPMNLTGSFNSSQKPVPLLTPPKKEVMPPAAAVKKPFVPSTPATEYVKTSSGEIPVIESQPMNLTDSFNSSQEPLVLPSPPKKEHKDVPPPVTRPLVPPTAATKNVMKGYSPIPVIETQPMVPSTYQQLTTPHPLFPVDGAFDHRQQPQTLSPYVESEVRDGIIQAVHRVAQNFNNSMDLSNAGRLWNPLFRPVTPFANPFQFYNHSFPTPVGSYFLPRVPMQNSNVELVPQVTFFMCPRYGNN